MNASLLISDEIEGLHEFFQQFFTGVAKQSSATRFEDVLDDNFTLITPGGQIISRENIIATIRQSHATRNKMRIWTEIGRAHV